MYDKPMKSDESHVVTVLLLSCPCAADITVAAAAAARRGNFILPRYLGS